MAETQTANGLALSAVAPVALSWQGHMIGAETSHFDGPKAAPYFRRDVEVGRGLRRATLHVTALGIIEARLNGRPVGDEVLCPGWTSYRHRLLVSSHDVTGLMTQGLNALGAIVGEGWAVGRAAGWAEKRGIWSDRPAAYMQLLLDYGDRVDVIATDDTWRTATGAVLEDGIYDGVTYDAGRDPAGWDQPGFDDAGWAPVRRIDWDLSRLQLRSSPPIRRMEELAVHELLTTPSGHTVADFGQVLSGWVRLRVSGPRGTTITLRHCELMVDGEPEYESNRTARATDTYVLRGNGPEVWEPLFTFHGFRYVAIEGWPGDLSGEDLTAVVVHTDMERTGWFETSHEQLNQLHRNVVWSFRGNAVGIPSDCPQRDERLGWTGDINAFAPTAAFLYDVSAFLGSWLEDLSLEQEEYGTVPMVVPDVLGHHHGPTALWGDVAVSLPWTLYMEYGDEELLRRQYSSMKAFVESVMDRIDERDIWSRGFQFGDWLDPDAPPTQSAKAKTEATLVATAYLCRTLGQLAAAASVIGATDDVAWAEGLRARVRSGFRREWVAPSGRVVNETQTAYALAICFGLLDPDEARRAGERLADLVVASGYHIKTGFAGTPWVMPALTRCGQLDAAYRLLLQTTPPSFLYPVTMGATTVWERWDAVLPDGKLNSTGMTSLNHYALGAVAAWMHQAIGGIEALEPGYRRVRVAPSPGGGLEWARAAHDTAHGRIEVDWVNRSGQRELRVTVPEGMTAEVELVGHPDATVVTVGAGRHEWKYPVAPDTFRTYDLATPIAVLKADPTVWSELIAILSRQAPEGLDVTGYIESMHRNLRSVLAGIPESDQIEQEVAAVLSGATPIVIGLASRPPD